MINLIVDSSVWIDWFTGKKNPQIEYLRYSLENNFDIKLCPVILIEVLQGIKKDSDFQNTKEIFSYFDVLNIDQNYLLNESVNLFRKLRKNGVTVKTIDCIIAVYAMHFNYTLLHNDGDFELIKRYSKLKTINEF